MDLDAAEIGQAFSGLFDVVFAFSLALERKGLLPRSEIVEALQLMKDQATEQEGRPTKRTMVAELMVAELMLAAFDLPHTGDQVRARWQVIDGGDGR